MEDIRELAKEVLEKREISKGKKDKEKLEPLKEYYTEPVTNPKSKEAKEAKGLKVHTTQPMFIDCPYCGERRKPRGIGGHAREKHGVPSVSMKELLNLQKEENEKSLEEFTREKLGNKEIEIKNIPTEILKREFPTWAIPGQEEDLEEAEEEHLEAEPEEDLEEEEKNPGNPELKENPKNEYEWTNPDLPFPFNLLRRKKVREK